MINSINKLFGFLGKAGLVISLACLSCACSGSADHRGPSFFDEENNPITVGGSNEFDPSIGTPLPPRDETETPPTECEKSGTIAVSPHSINFGLNQINTVENDIECQSLSVTPCYHYSIEIAEGASFYVNDKGNPATARLNDLTGDSEICYLRDRPGHHSGRANVIVENGAGAFVINLSGDTVPELISISAPQHQQLVWENTATITPADASKPYLEYFPLNTSGQINLAHLDTATNQALVVGHDMTISVGNGGVTQKTTFDEAGNFSLTVEIPTFPKVYPITFTINTSKGPLTKTVEVIRYTKPFGSLTIRNPEGTTVSSTSTYDLPGSTANRKLTAALEIKNLSVSAPDVSHDLKISFRLERGNDLPKLYYEGEEKGVGIWSEQAGNADQLDFFNGWVAEATDTRKCPVKVESPNDSVCIPLPPTPDLARGHNMLIAEVCNEFVKNKGGKCVEFFAHIIVDNDLPRIELIDPDSPPKRSHYAKDEPPHVHGYVENFSVMTTTTEGKAVSMFSKDGTCVNSSIKLWLNTPIESPGISICPAINDFGADKADTGNAGNIRRGELEIDLNQSPYKERLLPYTNLLHIRATNASGHTAIKTVNFQIGELNPSHRVKKNLFTGPLGAITNNQGKTAHTPIMLGLNEQTIESDELKAILKKWLNENFKFSEAAMNILSGLPKDEQGRVKIGEKPGIVPSMDQIINMLHRTAPEQVKALEYYQYDPQTKKFNPELFFPADVAQDNCSQPITTAIITPKMYQHLYPYEKNAEFIDEINPLWPHICRNEPDPLNCDTVVEGKWDIDLDLKDDGFIDIKLSLENEDVINGLKQPAFWGHFISYNLVKDGTTGAYSKLFDFPKKSSGAADPNGAYSKLMDFLKKSSGAADPNFTLLMSMERIEINLIDMVRLMKAQLKGNTNEVLMCKNATDNSDEPCPCSNNHCTNYIHFYADRIHDSNTSVKLIPYTHCRDFFATRFPEFKDNWPYGCSQGSDNAYPITVDTTSNIGENHWLKFGQYDPDGSILPNLIKDVFNRTFKNTIACMGQELLNPILTQGIIEYPTWTDPNNKIEDLTLALIQNQNDDSFGVVLEEKKTADEKTLFTVKPDVAQADITINDGSLKVKLPLTLGTPDVDISKLPSKTFGHMFRPITNPTSFEDHYPLVDTQADSTQLGVSLSIEEITNAASHLLLRKGVDDLLDILDLTELTPPSSHTLNDWTIGLDKVILGRFDICESLGGELLSTTLAPETLFPNIAGLFASESAHWDITVDPNNPPTLLLDPLSVTESANQTEATVVLGLSNITIDVRDLIEDNSTANYFRIGNSVTTVRLDALVKLGLRYQSATRQLEIFIRPLSEQVFYFSVAPSDPSDVYNDLDIVGSLNSLLIEVAIEKLSNNDRPSLVAILPGKVSEMGEVCLVKKDLGDDGTVPTVSMADCDENETSEDPFVGLLVLDQTDLVTENPSCKGNPPLYSPSYQDIAMIAMAVKDGLSINYLANLPSSQQANDPNAAICDYNPDVEAGSLQETLCDFGIEDILFKANDPKLELDIKNGYIHLSIEPELDIYEKLFNDVSLFPEDSY